MKADDFVTQKMRELSLKLRDSLQTFFYVHFQKSLRIFQQNGISLGLTFIEALKAMCPYRRKCSEVEGRAMSFFLFLHL